MKVGLNWALTTRAFPKIRTILPHRLLTVASTSNSSSPLIASTPLPQAVASATDALKLIRSEPSQYVIATFLGRRYILSPRDLLTVPRIRDVGVGDVLSLSAIQELGSRQYTLRGDPVLPHGTVNVTATVVEHTKGRMEKIVKTKRRKGYRKTIEHKQTYTRLRIGPIEIGTSAEPHLTQQYTE